MESENFLPPLLTLELVPGSDVLQATFVPEPDAVVLDLTYLNEALTAQGYGNYYLFDQALEKFIDNCAQAQEPVTMAIGERRNGTFSLDVSDDLMAAWLTLTPPQGGRPVTVEVNDELRDQGITFGIRHSALDAALAEGSCDHLLIAQGTPPQNGTPGYFDVLFGLTEKIISKVDEKAKIKFRDLSNLLLVHANDPLMRLYPSTQGKSGTDIKGQVVLAAPVPDVTYDADLAGSKPDQTDPHLLVATQPGQPVAVNNGVIVNPVITVQNVDLSTGQISFEGTIHVEGDIKAGMRVNVTGDVIVNGMIESAEVIAGGNVAVKGGVIGRAEKKLGTQNLADTAAVIRCSGSVQALFMENAHVESGNAITIIQNVRNCELIARNEIIVGKSGASDGQILGGRAQASLLVQADVLGSTVATKTRIQVGVDPYLEEQIKNKQAVIQGKVDELDQVLKLIVFFERNPKKNVGGVAEKVEMKRVQQLAEIDTLTKEQNLLEAQLEMVDKACVKISKTVYDGVEIQIGRQTWKVRENTGGGTYRLHENIIILT